MEMVSASGVLRITITPQLSLWILLEAAVVVAIVAMGWKQWPQFYHEQPVVTVLFLLGLLSGLWYQIAGSEEIEFNQQTLRIRKNRPLRPKTLEFALRNCSQLGVHEPREGQSDRLCCKANGSTVTFGSDLTEAQASQILVELQRVMPEAADQLFAGAADPFGKHFTLLNLK
jgi:hypothetical protein